MKVCAGARKGSGFLGKSAEQVRFMPACHPENGCLVARNRYVRSAAARKGPDASGCAWGSKVRRGD